MVGCSVVVPRVRRLVPPAPDVAAEQAHPEVDRGCADLAAGVVVAVDRVATHRARRVAPLLQALVVETVVAHLHTCVRLSLRGSLSLHCRWTLCHGAAATLYSQPLAIYTSAPGAHQRLSSQSYITETQLAVARLNELNQHCSAGRALARVAVLPIIIRQFTECERQSASGSRQGSTLCPVLCVLLPRCCAGNSAPL